MSFSNAIRHIKSSEQLTLREISELSGIPYSTIKHYSTGVRSPSRSNIQKLISVARFQKYSDLLIGADHAPTSDLDNEISRVWQELKAQGRESEALAILNYVLNKP